MTRPKAALCAVAVLGGFAFFGWWWHSMLKGELWALFLLVGAIAALILYGAYYNFRTQGG